MDQVEFDPQLVKRALQDDTEFMLQFFLGDELTLAVPHFHFDVFDLMVEPEIDRVACAIPRDHAKTTLAKLAVVHHFLFSKFQFILYMSKTHLQLAVPACNDIIAMLECDNFRAVFGDLEWIVRQDGKGRYIFKINGKLCILFAMSIEQQTRGLNVGNRRPQLAVCDDIEDNDSVSNEQMFLKRKRWFYGPFRKCLDKFGHKIIHIGNMLDTSYCLLAEHCNSEYWHSRLYGVLKSDGSILWEDAWPLWKLKRDFVEYQSAGMGHIWFAEMMNVPLADGGIMIKPQEITYKPEIEPDQCEMAFITIDLAISDNPDADEVVVMVHAWNGTAWQIGEYEAWRGIDPVQLWRELVPFILRWRITVVGIESVAYQAAFIHIASYFAQKEGMNDIEFIPLKTYGQSKVMRLMPFCGMLRAGTYVLTEGDFTLTQEITRFDPKKRNNKDDHCDAASYGLQIINEHADKLQRRNKMGQIQYVQTLAQISSY
jgi:hypothetical protein